MCPPCPISLVMSRPASLRRLAPKSVRSRRRPSRPTLVFHLRPLLLLRDRAENSNALELQGILGVLSPGAFAEYFKAPARNLFRLPESVPFDAGGLIADAVVTSVHAVKRSRSPSQETRELVLGAGGVGQILIQILRSQDVRVVGDRCISRRS